MPLGGASVLKMLILPMPAVLRGSKNVPHCAAETEIEHEEKIVLSAFGLGNGTSHDPCGLLG